MKQGIFIVMAALLIVGCKQKNESLQLNSDTLTGSALAHDSARRLVYQDCNAIVVGEGVRLRSAPDTKADVVEKLNTGALLKIIRSGEKKVILGKGDQCNPDGFYWYEVLESGGKKGWIYGEFIYRLIIKGRNDENLDDLQAKLFSRQYMFGEQWYGLGYAVASRAVKYEEETDTVCVDFVMPFFYHEKEGVVYPFKFIPNNKNKIIMSDLTKEKGYFQFAWGSYNDDYLWGYRMIDDELQLTLARESDFEEDPLLYTLRVRPGTGLFTATPADSGKEYLPKL
ncbi:MAG: SH3 domain-containing protein [Bacteroidales bacterium]